MDVPKDIIDINQSGSNGQLASPITSPSSMSNGVSPDANHNHLQVGLHGISPVSMNGAALFAAQAAAAAAAAAMSPKLTSLNLNGYSGLKGNLTQ